MSASDSDSFICIMQKKDSDEHVVLTKAGPSAETFSEDMFSKVCHPFSALYYIGSSVKTLICPIYIYILLCLTFAFWLVCVLASTSSSILDNGILCLP